MKEKLFRTQLYEIHKKKAKMAPFAGFEMPLWYKGVNPEHLAVRNSVGIFDISHMGRVLITGSDSEDFLNYVITNDVSVMSLGNAIYSVMCNEKGGILDDFVVYRLKADKFMIVFNASNRAKDYNWLVQNIEGFRVEIVDVSDDVAMFAVQGPRAEVALQQISKTDLSKLGRFKCEDLRLKGIKVFVSRTGYTGEDGFEIFVWNASLLEPTDAVKLWGSIMETGEQFGIEPCGLGARDTLRLEAGMCLYGNDIDENTTPLEARLSFVVKFKKESFIGKDALLRRKKEGLEQKRVGFKMLDKGIPRPAFGIYDNKKEKIGQVTSGTFSPLLKYGIGMAYIQVAQAQTDNLVNIKIRDRLAKGRIVSFPFYDTEKYGYKRKA
ncbi:MAG: glycine cleavage system aminomethyltransferase GcvT [Candidatus Bathyarchaeota archaeon]|jgi:aminomethyltransferase